MTHRTITRLLVANRAEIASRVFRTCRAKWVATGSARPSVALALLSAMKPACHTVA